MTTIEILVTVGGLLIGYWVVANLVLANKRERPARPPGGAIEQATHADPPEHQPWHVVLKVSRDATTDEIRAAYASQARQCHSDSVSGLGDEIRDVADRRYQQIEAAYREAMSARGHG